MNLFFSVVAKPPNMDNYCLEWEAQAIGLKIQKYRFSKSDLIFSSKCRFPIIRFKYFPKCKNGHCFRVFYGLHVYFIFCTINLQRAACKKNRVIFFYSLHAISLVYWGQASCFFKLVRWMSEHLISEWHHRFINWIKQKPVDISQAIPGPKSIIFYQ